MSSTTNTIIARMPAFYQSGEHDNLLYKFVELFATVFDKAEEDLLSIMKMHWVKTVDNVLPISEDTTVRGDLDKIFALYLDSLGATSLLKQGKRRQDTEGGAEDDALYRQRILSIINVLKNGASTKQGIIDIIAANLGIAADLPFAKEARDSIRIVEFLPEVTKAEGEVTPFLTKFTAINDNPVPVIAEIRLKFHTEFVMPMRSFFNPRIVNLTTGDYVEIRQEVKTGDEIIFLTDNTALLNGVEIKDIKSMTLPVGVSNLRFEVEVGLPLDAPKEHQIGLFYDEDEAQFKDMLPAIKGRQILYENKTRFDGAVFAYETTVAHLRVTHLGIHAGAFTAVVPWDIAGFSVSLVLTDEAIARLKIFGLAQNPIDKLAIWVDKNKKFETIEAFYNALPKFNLTEIEKKEILILATRRAQPIQKTKRIAEDELKKMIAGECEFTDKYARFDINPRAQLIAIINRVKAAGVYAEVAFEKKFWEHQELGETWGMKWQRKAEIHDMDEGDFSVKSTQEQVIEHDMIEEFNASDFGLAGVFDYTYFDSLNGFA